MEAVSSSGSWTRREFVRVQRRELRIRRTGIVLLAVLLVYGLIFGYLIWCLVVGVAIYAISVLIIIPLILWKRSPGANEERTITVSDLGISVVSQTTSRNENWGSYKRSIERREYYALQKIDHQPSTIILKRFFIAGGDEAPLRALLKAHTNAQLRENSRESIPETGI
jgi:hypothetical protein